MPLRGPIPTPIDKVPVPRVDGLELAAVNRNARFAEQRKASAQHHKLTADPADGLAIVLAEVGYCFEVRHQAAGQPNQLDVALALPLQAPARLYPIKVSVDVNLQQRRRMVSRPSRRLRLYAAKAQLGQIKLIDKDIDRSNRIVLAQIVIQPLRKQSALTAVIANDKARHRILRPNRRRIISLKVFSHSLGHQPTCRPRNRTSVQPTGAGTMACDPYHPGPIRRGYDNLEIVLQP